MRIYLTSDTHYMHRNIIKYCNRPYADEYEMNRDLVARYNSVVSPDDICIHVGDVSAGLARRQQELSGLIRSLNGRKALIRGNHDHETNDWYLQNGFERVETVMAAGDVLLIHYPLVGNDAMAGVASMCNDNTFVVHGHTHGPGPNHPRHFNVAIDRNTYAPVASEVAVPSDLHTVFRDAIIAWMT